MTKEEILHLANLSRVNLNEEEVSRFQSEISSILDYVGAINEMVADQQATVELGTNYNVFRNDEVTDATGSKVVDLVDSFPESQNNLLKVKKILNPEE